MVRVTKEEKASALDRLREFLPVGSTVYYDVRKVARSGMSRRIKFYTVSDGHIVRLSYLVAKALGLTVNDDGVRRDGWGYDAGFDTVYLIGRALWPNGTPKPHGTRNGEPDSCGGYALKAERL